MSATGAVILGTLAGLVLSRFGPFKGRALLQGLTTAPLVMPEVITGLSMLLLFVSLEQVLRFLFGWQFDRGVVTIIIAHITFTMAYVTVVVQSRLAYVRRLAGRGRAGPRRAAGQGLLQDHRVR